MLLKEVFSFDFLNLLAISTPSLNKKKFLEIVNENFAEKSLKQRMRAISLALNQSLISKNYAQKIDALKICAVNIVKDKNSSLTLIIFADFVEVFGACDFDLSMNALEFFTEFGSSEFAVRSFVVIDQKRALQFFTKWSKSENHHVRRLASEGLRPRLPWGFALEEFKQNPSVILPILENLKNDPVVYVQKSVANNFNDISKDHPQLVLSVLKRWKKEGVSDFIIRHALRTLLKKGDEDALKLIGIDKKNSVQSFKIKNFSLEKVLKKGENLVFYFTLENQVFNNRIRLEYCIYFLQKNRINKNSYSKKVFQITTKNFTKGTFSFTKKHSFADLTTRKHYSGEHFISLLVNGNELPKIKFTLI